MRNPLFILFSICVLSLFPSPASGTDWNRTLARYDGGEVTALELAVDAAHVPDYVREKLEQAANYGYLADWIRKIAAQEIVSRQVLEQEGITDIVAYPGIAEYYEMRLPELLNQFLIIRPSQPTDEEVKAYYQDHILDYSVREKVTFRHVFLRIKPDTPDEERERRAELARSIHKEIVEGADIGQVAKRYAHFSEGQANPGEPVTALVYRMNAPMQNAVANLRPGDITPPFRTPHGWEILQFQERHPPEPIPLEENWGTVWGAAAGEKREQARQSLQRRIDQQLPVVRLVDSASGEATGQAIFRIGERLIDASQLDRVRARKGGSHPAEVSEQECVQSLQWAEWAKVGGFSQIDVIKTTLQREAFSLVAGTRIQNMVDEMMYEPEESELVHFYERDPERFRLAEQRSGWMLTIDSGANVLTRPISRAYFMQQEMKKRQQEAREAIENGLPFQEAVLLYSTEAEEVARDGYLPLADFHGRAFDTHTQELKPGDPARWFCEDWACYYIQLEQRVPPHVPSFEEATDKVREMWEQDFRERAHKDVIGTKTQEKNFTIDWDALHEWDFYTKPPGLEEYEEGKALLEQL